MLDPADSPQKAPNHGTPRTSAATDPSPTTEPSPLADCCEVDPRISRAFNKRLAELMVDGELPEMVDVSRMLLGQLSDVATVAPTVLELGCGSAALLVELLKRGAARGDGIDLSVAMVAGARRRAEEAGVSERMTVIQADGALVRLEQHDWVLLDRAICCYPHVEHLLGNATSAAASRVGFSVPTTRGWRGLVNKIAWRAENIPVRLGRPGCPGYVHDLGRIEATLASAGFTKRSDSRLGLWYAAVWERAFKDS